MFSLQKQNNYDRGGECCSTTISPEKRNGRKHFLPQLMPKHNLLAGKRSILAQNKLPSLRSLHASWEQVSDIWLRDHPGTCMNTNVPLRDILQDSGRRFNLGCVLAPCKSDRADFNNLRSQLIGTGSSFSFCDTWKYIFSNGAGWLKGWKRRHGECAAGRLTAHTCGHHHLWFT